MRPAIARTHRLLAVAGLACLLAACVGSRPHDDADALRAEGEASPSFSSLVASRAASVVDISTLRIGRDESPDDELEFAPESDFADRQAWALPVSTWPSEIRDLASGIIIAGDGLILTSAHLITRVDEAQVRLGDGRRFTARVLGVDKRTDVALLKIEASGLPVAVIGDSSTLRPGDWLAAIGSPFGFHGSVTTGVVSATGRYIAGAGEVPFIQTDTAINPGSSGSPLFNRRGEVVGINSLIYSASGGYMGLSFAVPINLAMKTAARLRSDGRVRRTFLGAELQEVTPALARSFAFEEASGALVVRVNADGPAHAAGLAPGDIVTAFEGRRVARFDELLDRIAERPPGTRARMDIWRAGSARAVYVTLSEQAPDRNVLPPSNEHEWGDGLGLRLGVPAALQLRQLGLDAGLLVRESLGAARSEGIRAGDLIVAINDKRLERIEDFRRILTSAPPGGTVALLVARTGRMSYVPIRLPSAKAHASSIGSPGS